MIVLALKF